LNLVLVLRTPEDEQLQDLSFIVAMFRRCYPKFVISPYVVRGTISGSLVSRISKFFTMSPSFVFLACPVDGFSDGLEKFCGARIITHES
jgi:hypothetical protein